MSGLANNRRALLLMLAGTMMWPVLELSGVSLMPRHHALQVVFFRYAAHLLLLLAVLLPRHGVAALRTCRPVLQLLRGACMFGMPLCYVLAADFATSAWIWSVFWTMPALALIGAVVVLRERPHPFAWVAVALGFVGATAIRGGAGGSVTGTVLALGMAATFAAYMVLSRVLRDEPLSASLFYTAVGAIVPTALVVWRVWTPLAVSDYLPVLAVGAFSIVILSLLDLALEAAPVALTVPLLSLVPIWETVAIMPLRRVLPSTSQMAGIVVILIGALFWMNRSTLYPARMRDTRLPGGSK